MIPYKELIVWQKAVEFSLCIYTLTSKFPESEKFGLVSQMRRASVSIPSNIAEGSKRGTVKDYVSFLRIASGSGAELETQLYISQKLNYLSQKEYIKHEQDINEIMKILGSLIKKYSA